MNQLPRMMYGTALLLLVTGIASGCLAALWYISPSLANALPGFVTLRPLHVSLVILWILTGATGVVTSILEEQSGYRPPRWIQLVQLLCWWCAIAGIVFSYLTGQFGGREYWEFPPAYSGFIAAGWMLFLYQFIMHARCIRRWPVYMWMWMTGSAFFLLTFAENYLWLFPWFREHFITDLTVQWKANGSLVGSWNQLIYGTAFYLMDRISGNTKTGYSRKAFAMYFLGLFNLMFNWGHHIYPLPGPEYIRMTGYLVSMTEWVFFIAIIRDWRNTFRTDEFRRQTLPYRFLMAADFWVFLNLSLALIMSVPALNLYTHGTHITVAHAMGATIGINTMILLAAGSYWFEPQGKRVGLFFATQVSLLVFWLSLITAGVIRGQWRMDPQQAQFGDMMRQLQPVYVLFFISGIALMVCLTLCAMLLLSTLAGKREAREQPAPA